MEQPEEPKGTGQWEFLRAAFVVVALVVLTVLVIEHYGMNSQDAATILGITAPILAAVVGGSIGYTAGNTSGQSTGANKLKHQLDDPVRALDRHLSEGEVSISGEAREALGELKGLAKQ
jgi:hypothetical protein